jgi:hypothetical protein
MYNIKNVIWLKKFDISDLKVSPITVLSNSYYTNINKINNLHN